MSDVGLVFDSSSFDAFNRSLEKFRSIGEQVDKVLLKMASSIEKINVKKLQDTSVALLYFAKAAQEIAGINGLDGVAKSLKSITDLKTDFKPFVKINDEVQKLARNLELLDSGFISLRAKLFSLTLDFERLVVSFKKINEISLNADFLKNFVKDVSAVSDVINKNLLTSGSGGTGGIFGKIKGLFESFTTPKPIEQFVKTMNKIASELKKLDFAGFNITQIISNLETFFSALKKMDSIIVGNLELIGKSSGDAALAKIDDSIIKKQRTYREVLLEFINGFEEITKIMQRTGLKAIDSGLFVALTRSITALTGFLGNVSKIAADPAIDALINSDIIERLRVAFKNVFELFIDAKSNQLTKNIGKLPTENLKPLSTFLSSMAETIQLIGRIDFNKSDIAKFKDVTESITAIFTGSGFGKFLEITDTGLLRKISRIFGGGGLIGTLSEFNSDLPAKFINTIANMVRAISDIKITRLDPSVITLLRDSVQDIIKIFVGASDPLERLKTFLTGGIFSTDIATVMSRFDFTIFEKIDNFSIAMRRVILSMQNLAEISQISINPADFKNINNGGEWW